MQMGDWTLKFEIDPFEPPNSPVQKLIQDRFEGRRISRIPALGQALRGKLTPTRQHISRVGFVGHLQPYYRIIKLFAITAGDRLHIKMKAAVCPARDLGSITALRTFKPVGATHAKAKVVWPSMQQGAQSPRERRTQQGCAQIHTDGKNVSADNVGSKKKP